MKKILFLFIVAFTCCGNLVAQQSADPVMLTVAGENVSRSEFENVPLKNNRDEKKGRKALEEDLNLFINYQLKGKEPLDSWLDTVHKSPHELGVHRKQLTQ